MTTSSVNQSLDEIEAEIVRLQSQAKLIRESEKSQIIERMRQDIQRYQIEARDLGFGQPSLTKRIGKSNTTEEKKTRTVKYRDDKGNIAYERGPRPKWLKEAIATGKSLSDFLVYD